MNTLVFDIETVPDTETGRLLYQLDEKKEAKEVAKIMVEKRQEKTGNTFLPHHLQRIVAISVAFRGKDQFKVASLGNLNSSEAEIIQCFYSCIEKRSPLLVSWNGSSFDLPVLHYRALLYGISSATYWNTGDDGDASFRWNNYLSRYHYRHSDLMDILAGYQGRANAPLTEIALMLGLPGKLGMDGSQVGDYFLEGKLQEIRNYCETDVLNTYLIYLRFQLIRGKLSSETYDKEVALTKEYLTQQEEKPHFKQFIAAWKNQ